MYTILGLILLFLLSVCIYSGCRYTGVEGFEAVNIETVFENLQLYYNFGRDIAPKLCEIIDFAAQIRAKEIEIQQQKSKEEALNIAYTKDMRITDIQAYKENCRTPLPPIDIDALKNADAYYTPGPYEMMYPELQDAMKENMLVNRIQTEYDKINKIVLLNLMLVEYRAKPIIQKQYEELSSTAKAVNDPGFDKKEPAELAQEFETPKEGFAEKDTSTCCLDPAKLIEKYKTETNKLLKRTGLTVNPSKFTKEIKEWKTKIEEVYSKKQYIMEEGKKMQDKANTSARKFGLM